MSCFAREFRMGSSQGSLKSFTRKIIYDSSKKCSYARKPLKMLSFEIASAMQKILDLWDQLESSNLETLKTSLEADEHGLMCGNANLRWRVAGEERRRELDSLCNSITIMGSFCQNKTLHNLRSIFSNVKIMEEVNSASVSSKHCNELYDYMRSMVLLSTNLQGEMQILESLLPGGKGISFEMDNWNKNIMLETPNEYHDRILSQVLLVTQLQSLSLWNCDRDESVEFLVLATCLIRKRLSKAFGNSRVTREEVSTSLHASGLALHYARLILTLDKMIQRPTQVLSITRMDLYNKLPTSLKNQVKSRLRNKRKPFDAGIASHLRQGSIILLERLMPLANLTLAWNLENSFNQQFTMKSKVLQVQTLYYARTDKVELAITEILSTLSYISRPVGDLEFKGDELEEWNNWMDSDGKIIEDTGFKTI